MKEQRRSKRVADKNVIMAKVDLAPFGYDIHGKLVVAETTDISETGMRLVLNQPIPVDTELDLRVAATNPPRSFLLHGRVLWCRSVNASSFAAGIHLERISDPKMKLEWEAFAATKTGSRAKPREMAGGAPRSALRDRGERW